MNNDRELLELAAKACKLPECGWMGDAFMYVKDNTFTDWNPLDSQTDCNKLASDCNLNIIYITIKSNAKTASETRRAITRAAAEIGKAMG